MIQNKSWKIDENIFHKKCPKQHSLITESVAGDVRDAIPSKNHEFSCFLLFCDYCRDFYSKCTHCDNAFQKLAF